MCATKSTMRRSARSARSPAGSVRSAIGTNAASPAQPSVIGSRVRSYRYQPTATHCICAASTLQKRPARNSAKSRLARTWVMRRKARSWPAPVKLRADDRHGELVALVQELPAELDDAAVGLARGEPRLEHGATVAQRVARPHRQREAPLV